MEKAMKLTQEQKRIKIAEACGISDAENKLGLWVNGNPFVPYYFNDLNACREMRRQLRYDQRAEFVKNVYLLTPSCVITFEGIDYGNLFGLVDSTPESHAEAFGQTLGLWQPGD